MQEIHGPLEWISLQDMARATEMCIRLVQLWSGAAKPALAEEQVGDRYAAATGSPVDWVG
jgi:tripeptide aminopeptidase